MNTDQQLQQINKKLDDIEKQLTEEEMKINTHPLVFLALLIVFFIVMDLWAAFAKETILHIHPRDRLYFWEYAILAIIATVLLVWVVQKTGFSLRMLESG